MRKSPSKRAISNVLPLIFIAYVLVGVTAAAKEPYRVPRLADGQPDFQGNWDHTDCTPLERPAGIATLVITPEQAAQIERSIELATEDRATPTEPTEFFNPRRRRR